MEKEMNNKKQKTYDEAYKDYTEYNALLSEFRVIVDTINKNKEPSITAEINDFLIQFPRFEYISLLEKEYNNIGEPNITKSFTDIFNDNTCYLLDQVSSEYRHRYEGILKSSSAQQLYSKGELMAAYTRIGDALRDITNLTKFYVEEGFKYAKEVEKEREREKNTENLSSNEQHQTNKEEENQKITPMTLNQAIVTYKTHTELFSNLHPLIEELYEFRYSEEIYLGGYYADLIINFPIIDIIPLIKEEYETRQIDEIVEQVKRVFYPSLNLIKNDVFFNHRLENEIVQQNEYDTVSLLDGFDKIKETIKRIDSMGDFYREEAKRYLVEQNPVENSVDEEEKQKNTNKDTTQATTNSSEPITFKEQLKALSSNQEKYDLVLEKIEDTLLKKANSPFGLDFSVPDIKDLENLKRHYYDLIVKENGFQEDFKDERISSQATPKTGILIEEDDDDDDDKENDDEITKEKNKKNYTKRQKTMILFLMIKMYVGEEFINENKTKVYKFIANLIDGDISIVGEYCRKIYTRTSKNSEKDFVAVVEALTAANFIELATYVLEGKED